MGLEGFAHAEMEKGRTEHVTEAPREGKHRMVKSPRKAEFNRRSEKSGMECALSCPLALPDPLSTFSMLFLPEEADFYGALGWASLFSGF